MLVICTVAVLLSTDLGVIDTTDDLIGKVLVQSSSTYLVDFSEDASKRYLIGDYSEKLVSKYKCTKLTK